MGSTESDVLIFLLKMSELKLSTSLTDSLECAVKCPSCLAVSLCLVQRAKHHKHQQFFSVCFISKPLLAFTSFITSFDSSQPVPLLWACIFCFYFWRTRVWRKLLWAPALEAPAAMCLSSNTPASLFLVVTWCPLLPCTTRNLFLFHSFLFRGCQSLNNLRVNKWETFTEDCVLT